MALKEFVDPELGEIRIFKKHGIKNISITVKPFEGIRVSIPGSVSYARALKYIQEKRNWIMRAKSKVEAIENQQTVFSESSVFSTRNHTLHITRNGIEKPGIRVARNRIQVNIPKDEPIASPKMQNLIRTGIERAWMKEAKDIIPAKVNELANRHGFSYASLTIRRTISRWGSCSSQNHISLSLYLMQLPEYLMDYVLLHELVHTKVKNHQKAFWDHMDAILGDAKSYANEIKNYKPGVY